ncbi:sodium ABC transporter [Brevibacillus agri]|uniref:ABC transporter permease n=1 Tax=Brevibacillus agri TaxID=51101 RepID=A0A3M8ANN7_9BACL|nr:MULTISPECIES: ABC transporter permease [Brevibacillus]ELK41035.1 Na(+) extrusion ABC transporter permease [Brevibacillus agri BAB-2500]MBG9567623.1 sodium ABC transporter permease [Brevibacillus agri]MBY0053177.1 ABC transporter permease [Brevibacillus agri]MDN4094987.1 ABC transporter permease [Brevibacillus agri]MED1646206.1 ABC transporter permease [Brevibacillus agri]
MDWQIIWTVFKKELLDLFRDRKAWLGTFLVPLVIIPFVFFLLGNSYSNVEKEAREYVPLAVHGSSKLIKSLQENQGVKILQPPDPEQALQAGQLRAIITIPESFDEQIQAGKTATLHVAFDSTNSKSVYARDLIERTVEAYSKEIVAKRLKQAGLSEQTIQPIAPDFQNVASEERQSGGMLAGIIPLMLVVSLASGGIASANDLVAGEKERGTLESLLTAPIAANHILTAKLLAVMVMSIMSAGASLISVSLVMSMGPFGGAGDHFSLAFFSPVTLLVLIVVILLMAATFAGLELMLSTIAKSFKEGQTYMSGVIFLAMVPSYMLMPQSPVDIAEHYYALPVFNGVALCKEVFYGKVDPLHALVGIGSSLVYVAITIFFASRLFRREGAGLKN